ncbi:DUF819 family protein [Corallincola luteus]|uniref:DUF819 family protein n=1 Tax=Corallincola luteus TaxID=1775177 RepID=A0ABY2APV0_9GAMM|nr:DUF819 family protein [Corallincola luteus]TCI05220.1 DUF819 family protein [Corallincola luteus]
MHAETALITNDATILGILAVMLGGIFYTAYSSHPFWRKFYKYVPAILLCYFLPSFLNTFGVVDGHDSNLYFVASRYLLPACLVLLTLSVDLKAITKLGNKAVILFLTGTVGIVIGGPIAILLVSVFAPEVLGGNGPDAVWRGMTTVAGSWIGGGANQAAMKEVYDVGGHIFSVMATVDVVMANIWMAILLLMAGNAKKIDARTGADTSAIEALKERVEKFHAEHGRIPHMKDLMVMIAIGFGVTGIGHALADVLAPWFADNVSFADRLSLNKHFFWLIIIATTLGLMLSFTKARKLEAVGASKVGSVMLYILIATIGLHMDITAIVETPLYFLIGAIWMVIHALLMLLVAKLIKAPLFYMAVGSQANVGGAASAPVVASAFHPALAPVGVLLAVLGYVLGTYMAWFCGQLLQLVAV